MLSNEALKIFGRTSAVISGIEATPSVELSRADKNKLILIELRDGALKKAGQIYIVGSVPHLVMPDGRMVALLPKTPAMDEILIACGVMPESSTLDKALFRFLLADSSFPENEIIGLFKYRPAEHELLVNLHEGHYLRFGGDGCPSVHVNGERGLLFTQGGEGHMPDLDLIGNYQGGAFSWNEDSPLVKHVFSVGVYSPTSGVGRQVAIDVELAWLLAGMFQERVKAQPLLHLHGLGGTRKTAIATALGWVISPKGMGFHVVAAPDDRGQMETTLINADGLLCLDEANNLRLMFSLLKAIITNATIERRILYTTANIQRFVVRLLCILTTNHLEMTDEQVARRVLKVDMGNPSGVEASYRGDGAVEREWREGNLRHVCFTDLLCRAGAAMRLLTAARAKSEDEPVVRYRMSGFWSLILAVANQEGPEILERMTKAAEDINAEQSRSVNTSDDLLPLLQDWLEKRPENQGKDLSASEIGEDLTRTNIYLSASTAKLLGSALMLSNKLTSSSEYVRLLGMEVVNSRRTKKFRFDLSKVKPEDLRA
ncbi:MAG: hypothetical protein WA383_15030 [Terriglobales bacterium]|jgi:hypothetical protein